MSSYPTCYPANYSPSAPSIHSQENCNSKYNMLLEDETVARTLDRELNCNHKCQGHVVVVENQESSCLPVCVGASAVTYAALCCNIL